MNESQVFNYVIGGVVILALSVAVEEGRRLMRWWKKRHLRRRLNQITEEVIREERARLHGRLRETDDHLRAQRARAHREHPVVHRWPNDGGLGGAA